MELSQKVCSLDLAMELNALDVEQESLFYYHWYKKNRDWEDIDVILKDHKTEEFDDGKWKLKVYSAFTSAELMELLLPFCNELEIEYRQDADASYYRVCSYIVQDVFDSIKLADSLAQMLIVLLQSGIMKNGIN